LFVAAVLRNIYGAFTKVARFDLVKAVAHGMAIRHGQKVPIPMVFKPSCAPLHGLFDLEIISKSQIIID
jgi:hypothetical protein